MEEVKPAGSDTVRSVFNSTQAPQISTTESSSTPAGAAVILVVLCVLLLGGGVREHLNALPAPASFPSASHRLASPRLAFLPAGSGVVDSCLSLALIAARLCTRTERG